MRPEAGTAAHTIPLKEAIWGKVYVFGHVGWVGRYTAIHVEAVVASRR
jgi:hypothetical protein